MTTIAVVVAAALVISRVDYVPMWDGFIYAEAIADALAAFPSPDALRLAGHSSQAYSVLAVAAQRLAPESTWPILLLNGALFGLACVGFARLTRLAFDGPEHRLDRALLFAAFALQPSFLASVVQPGIDLPLLPGFIWCTVFLLERRWLLAAACGVAIVFTKETGVLLYAALFGTVAVWTFVRDSGGLRERLRRLLPLLPCLLPLVAFAAYLVWRQYTIVPGETVVWESDSHEARDHIRKLLIPRFGRELASFFAMMGVLNFTWVATAFIIIAAAMFVRRRLRGWAWRQAWRESLGAFATVVGFTVALTAALVFVLSRFTTYANVRYVLVELAIMYVPFYAALLALGLAPVARRAVLAAFGLALLVSNVRTIDPVSRTLYGTFAVGDRSLLRMTRITYECCGAGRDQLAYNLEFTTLEALISDALAAIAPRDSALVIVPTATNWFVATRVDPVTHRRTMRRTPSIVPTVVETDALDSLGWHDRPAHYLALPNAWPEVPLDSLTRHYIVGPERRLRRDGYALSVYPLTPRGKAVVVTRLLSSPVQRSTKTQP